MGGRRSHHRPLAGRSARGRRCGAEPSRPSDNGVCVAYALTKRAWRVHDRAPVDERPEVAVEASEFALYGEEGPSVRDGSLDLGAVTHDTWVAQKARHVARGKARQGRGIEGSKGATVVLPLGQDGRPGKPRLRAVEDQH